MQRISREIIYSLHFRYCPMIPLWNRILDCVQDFQPEAMTLQENKHVIQMFDAERIQLVVLVLQSSEIPLEEQKRLQEETKSGSLVGIPATETETEPTTTMMRVTDWMDYVNGSEEKVQVNGNRYAKEFLLEWNRQSYALEIPTLTFEKGSEVLRLVYELANIENVIVGHLHYFLAPLVE